MRTAAAGAAPARLLRLAPAGLALLPLPTGALRPRQMAAALALRLCFLPCATAAGPRALPSWAVVPTGDYPHHLVVSFTETERQAALRAGAAGAIDWVARGAVTPPTSQGRCATCAYFAGTAAVEGAWKIAGHPLVKLSEQEEIDCYNNGGYAMPNMVHGIASAADAPLANHSDPNITGCRGITNCTHAKAHAWAYINGTRGSKTHFDADILALLQSGPAAVSIDAAAYSPYHGGIINCSGLRGVDHANALVGYGVEKPPAKCASQPANSSFETYCDTAFPLGAGGREWWGGIPGVPKGKTVTLEECCAACAREVGTPPEKPAWNTPRCGAANWKDGACTMMATDPTGHHYTGMASYAKNVTACVPFRRAPIATKDVGYFKVKNSWGSGFGEGGYARFIYGANCMRGVVQPYICPGPACPPSPPKPVISTLEECVERAKGCPNANFVSFSPKMHDCSWFKGCTFTAAGLRRFAGNGTDYQSQVLRSAAGGGQPAAGTQAVGCCGDLYECTRKLGNLKADCKKATHGNWDTFAPSNASSGTAD
jgi:hypothetical protein